MGGQHIFSWLTPGADASYLPCAQPDPFRHSRVSCAQILVTAGKVSKSAVAAEAGMHTSAATQWVVFTCSDRRFGLPLERVFEIMTPRPFTRLPGAGADVCGLVGLRGRVITVFDLGVVLGMRAASSTPDHRLLLLDLGRRRIGAAVDDVIAVAPALVAAASQADMESFGAGAVAGLGHTEDADFIALNPEPLLLRRLQD